MSYQCICEPRTLFLDGCRCGAWRAETEDRAAVERVAAYEARERLREMERFLIRPPTASITMRNLCGACEHPYHKDASKADICPDGSCLCIG